MANAADHEAAARIMRVKAVLLGQDDRTGNCDSPMAFRAEMQPAFLDEIDRWKDRSIFWGSGYGCPPSVFCMVPK